MRVYRHVFIIVVLTSVAGCAAFQSLTLKKPAFKYQDFHFQSISFTGVTLLFDFLVDNPNKSDIQANAYTYDFSISGQSFVSGRNEESFVVKGRDKSIVQVPVTLNYNEVFKAFGSLEYQDELPWEINSEIEVDVPGLGKQVVPVNAKGRIPLLKLPTFRMDGIEMTNFSMAGVDLIVKLRVVNPNAVALRLQNATYKLVINDQTWLDTSLNKLIEVGPKSDIVMNAPVKIDMRNFGVAAYRILTREEEFRYQVTGSGRIGIDLPEFRDFINIPFDLKGSYSIKALN